MLPFYRPQYRKAPPSRKKWLLALILLLVIVPSVRPVAAGVFDPLINILAPLYERITGDKNTDTAVPPSASEAPPPTARPKVYRRDIISETPLTTVIHSPSLAAVLQAEFELDRGDRASALARYKAEAMKDNATAVFERALSLSIQYDSPSEALRFASAWQRQNPDHIPALFYVTHLALKAENYPVAASYLRQILRYDPSADLSQIFVGILPNSDTAKRTLLRELQAIGGDDNPSLSVLKAGLLMGLNEPNAAILYLDNALTRDSDNLAYLILKADILKQADKTAALLAFLEAQITAATSDNKKQLILYKARYLIDRNDLAAAWLTLNHDPSVLNDTEVLLLASLLALDLAKYDDANRLLTALSQHATYADEAYYYLGLSHERMGDFDNALHYFQQVDDMQYILPATKKRVAYELLNDRPERAINALIQLRNRYEMFTSDSVLLQADILVRMQKSDAAKTLLQDTYQQYPDEPNLLVQYIKLLDDDKDYAEKRVAIDNLLALDGDNHDYQLLSASLALNHNIDDPNALALAKKLSIDNDSDTTTALLLLAKHAQAKGDYQAVLDYLTASYADNPTLAVGTALLRAYQGLGDSAQVMSLLNDLTHRFGNK